MFRGRYFVSTRFDYFLKCLLDEFFCKPVWANPYPVVIFQAKRFALSAQLTKAVRQILHGLESVWQYG